MASCCGCKFLFGNGSGYSYYTWMDTYVECALGANPALLVDVNEPFDWSHDPEADNFPATQNGRCERYSAGPYITCDPDRENHPADEGAVDDEQIAAICKAAGYEWPRAHNKH